MTATMGTIRRGYLDAPTGQVHYREAGAGGRPLLLLHQSPISGSQFDVVLPLFAARGFHAVAPDMAGFGMSDPAPEPLTLATYATVVPAALAHLGWSGCALVGHHTGAVVAGVHAVAAPGTVDALVLNGFPLMTDAERAHFGTFYFGRQGPVPAGTHLLHAWQDRLRSTPGWTDLELMHRYTVEKLVSEATNWKAFPLIIGADLSEVLRAITVRTLLLTNTGEDLYEATRRSHAVRPDFAWCELQGGTHDIVDEQPEAWAASVAAFLG